jgi:hypothetical protein
VQTLWSLQEEVMSVWAQPPAEQESAVHAFASSQLSGVPLWHVPLLQTSPAVHAFPSLQGLVLLTCPVQVPVSGSHVSSVHGLPSAQKNCTMTQCEKMSHASSVQWLPSHS